MAWYTIFLNYMDPRVIQHGSASPAQSLTSLKCRCAIVSVLIALDNFFSNAGTKYDPFFGVSDGIIVAPISNIQ